jgi:hypothetical protein
MNTVIHLNSASDLSQEILESIKLMFQSRPITIVVEDSLELIPDAEQKAILDSRMQEPDEHYLSAEKSIALLKKKYGL